MTDTRLIERWLPIAELGEESVRERRSMTALPPTYYLHVWWARRPLVASRAAILGSILPADADHEKFKHLLGIHGDPVKGRRLIEHAQRTGVRVKDPYGYDRAFGYCPDSNDRVWLARLSLNQLKILDPMAGGGTIPFEAVRLGIETFANELNPVAALITEATVAWPTLHGSQLVRDYQRVSTQWRR